ncbi:MAG: lytic transglycosylase domain-containing protein [Granulosicoccus sp.]
MAIALVTPNVHAQTSPFKHRAADGTVTFSDAPISNGKVVRTSYAGEKRKPAVANPCKGLTTAKLDAKGKSLDRLFTKASEYTGVPASLLKAVARAESCFDPKAVSRAGARGLMQLMPLTAKSLSIKNSFDAEQNIMGGARYLSAMLARYENKLDLALAAYNAGPGNVDRYNGVPPFKETQRYIVSVRAFQSRYTEMQKTATQLAKSED